MVSLPPSPPPSPPADASAPSRGPAAAPAVHGGMSLLDRLITFTAGALLAFGVGYVVGFRVSGDVAADEGGGILDATISKLKSLPDLADQTGDALSTELSPAEVKELKTMVLPHLTPADVDGWQAARQRFVSRFLSTNPDLWAVDSDEVRGTRFDSALATEAEGRYQGTLTLAASEPALPATTGKALRAKVAPAKNAAAKAGGGKTAAAKATATKGAAAKATAAKPADAPAAAVETTRKIDFTLELAGYSGTSPEGRLAFHHPDGSPLWGVQFRWRHLGTNQEARSLSVVWPGFDDVSDRGIPNYMAFSLPADLDVGQGATGDLYRLSPELVWTRIGSVELLRAK